MLLGAIDSSVLVCVIDFIAKLGCYEFLKLIYGV